MMRERLARLITNILNPFLISLVVITLLAHQATSRPADFIKWAAVSLAISVAPTFIIAVLLVKSKRLDSFFANPREQRYIIYLLATLLAALGCGLLWYFDAPELMLVTFIAGLISIVVFTGINYFWKISLHTAFIAASTAVVIIVYGASVAWACLLLPPVAWARVELKQHSLSQVITGSILAAAIVVGVFKGMGVPG